MLEVNVPQFGKVSNKLPRLCKPMLEKEAVWNTAENCVNWNIGVGTQTPTLRTIGNHSNREWNLKRHKIWYVKTEWTLINRRLQLSRGIPQYLVFNFMDLWHSSDIWERRFRRKVRRYCILLPFSPEPFVFSSAA
jgi:hypothetical protein